MTFVLHLNESVSISWSGSCCQCFVRFIVVRIVWFLINSPSNSKILTCWTWKNFLQDVFNLLPNLNVAELVKAFSGKLAGMPSLFQQQNLYHIMLSFNLLSFHSIPSCSENEWYDVGHIPIFTYPKCNCSP